MEKDFLKVIETRRSCRKYKPEQITDEELKAVLEAGTYAHAVALHCGRTEERSTGPTG